MKLNPSALEQTTAATDALLALVAVICALYLWRLRPKESWKIGLWVSAYLVLASASVLGTIAHGFALRPALSRLVWQPLNLFLGLTVALFVVGAIYDGWGFQPARKALPPFIAIGILFCGVGWFVPKVFYVFLPFQAAGLIFALAVYVRLTVRNYPGALYIALGIVASMIAAVMQANRNIAFTVLRRFDHRGLFHLIQMPALVLIAIGVAISVRKAVFAEPM